MNLIEAAKKGSYPDIIQCLNLSHDIEQKDAQGYTPLLRAAEYGHVSIVRLLLNNKANPDAITPAGSNALILACHNDKIEMIRLLLQEKAFSVDVKNKEGATPLHIAAARSSLEVCRELIAHKANVNNSDYVIEDNSKKTSGYTPLHIAASHSRQDIILLLLEHQADPTRQNGRTESPIDIATDENIKKILIEHYINLLIKKLIQHDIELPTDKFTLLNCIVKLPNDNEQLSILQRINSLYDTQNEAEAAFQLLKQPSNSLLSLFKSNPSFYFDYLLAVCYANGIGTKKDNKLALQKYLMAYKQILTAIKKSNASPLLNTVKANLRQYCHDYINRLKKSPEQMPSVKNEIALLYSCFYIDKTNLKHVEDLDAACAITYGPALLEKANKLYSMPKMNYDEITRYHYETATTDFYPKLELGIKGLIKCLEEKKTAFEYAKKACYFLLCSDHAYQERNGYYFTPLLTLLSSNAQFRLANWLHIKLNQHILLHEFINHIIEIYFTGTNQYLEPNKLSYDIKPLTSTYLKTIVENEKLPTKLKIQIHLYLALKHKQPDEDTHWGKALELDKTIKGTTVNSILNSIISQDKFQLKAKVTTLLNKLEREISITTQPISTLKVKNIETTSNLYPLLPELNENNTHLEPQHQHCSHIYTDYTLFATHEQPSAPSLTDDETIFDCEPHHSQQQHIEHLNQHIEYLANAIEHISIEKGELALKLQSASMTIQELERALSEIKLKNQWVRQENKCLKQENERLRMDIADDKEQQYRKIKFF